MTTNCTSEDYEKLEENQFICCSHHLTSFAVGEPFEVHTGRMQKAIAALVSLNVFLLASIIVGCLLDVKKVLLFDNMGKGTTLTGSDGAAAVEQSSAAMEMSSNIATGG